MRRNVLLIELLIGLTLTATLIGGLLALIIQLTYLGRNIDDELKPIATSCVTYKRLTQILSEVVLTEGGLFSLHNNTLVFIYNGGVDPDPLFSADVLGMLYHEEEDLVLATWPHPRHQFEAPPPYRTEVVAEGIEALSVALYAPEEGWLQEWEKGRSRLPLMIRLKLNDTPHTITLYHADYPLTFPKKER